MVIHNSERLCRIEIVGGDKVEHTCIMRESKAALAEPIRAGSSWRQTNPPARRPPRACTPAAQRRDAFGHGPAAPGRAMRWR